MVWRARLIRAAAAGCGSVLAGLVALAAGCGGGASTILVPVAYILAGRIVDPTTNPIAGIPGARVVLETAPQVRAVTSDSEGNFILQGVGLGTHRLRVTLTGRVTTISADLRVEGNVADALVPLFTSAQIDSVLTVRGAPAWDRNKGLFGLFALKSTGVPLGDAAATIVPPPGGSLVQTGEGADPIVVVNGEPGSYDLSIARVGYVWDGPYGVLLRPAVLTFAAPRARPNFNGFLFADLPGGPPIPGTTVTALRGPSAGTTATTNFIGQFSLVGLVRGTYVARFAPAGWLPTLSLPQPLDQDTTLAAVAFTTDSLATWSAARGGPAPNPAFGTIVLDVRSATSGAINGATVELADGSGFATPQDSVALAMRLNVAPGLHRIFARAPGYADSPAADSVEVRAGEVTFGRIDLELPTLPVRRRVQRR